MLKKNIIYLMTILALLMVSNNVYANAGMAFLRIGAGARAAGMGEAYLGAANDASAAFWNPAGLAHGTNIEVAFAHNQWIQDINHEFFSVAFQKGNHHFALSFISLNVDGIERRTKASTLPIGEIASHDVALGLSYARNISDNLQIGVTAKYLYERIYIESTYGFAADLGVQYQLNFMPGLTIGATAQNIGATSELKEESIKLPASFKIGAAYQIINNSLLAAVDVVQIQDYDMHVNLGAEYVIKNVLALRGGYQIGWDEKDLSAGFGVQFSRYKMEYAYTPFSSNLGNSQRIAISLKL